MNDTFAPGKDTDSLLARTGQGLGAIEFLAGTKYVAHAQSELLACRRLFESKLLLELQSPHPPPRIVIFIGGTNVGKSTMFNLFLGEVVAGPEETAGATKCPVILVGAGFRPAVDAERFLPGYRKEPLVDVRAANQLHDQPTAFLVPRERDYPWLLIDSPDIDSNVLENAGVGQDLLWLADSVVFVTSDQKYLDRRPLEFFRTARELKKELVVVFNKMEAEEKGRIIAEDFFRTAKLEAQDVTQVVMPYVPRLAPGDPSAERLAGVRTRLAAPGAGIKARALAGAAAFLEQRMGEVLETYEAEQHDVEAARTRCVELGRERRREFEQFARKLAGSEFFELERAIRNILEEYRIPYVDDFLVRVREGAGEMWSMLRRQFRKSEEPRPPIEQRRAKSFEESLRLTEGAGRAFRQYLRGRADDRELFKVLYERVACLELTDRAALEAAYAEASADREEFTASIEEKIRSWLADNPQKRAWLQAFKLTLRGGAGVLVAFLTGGIGVWDVVLGPLGFVASEMAVEHLAPPNFFKEFRDRFVALELAAFDAVLQAGYLGCHDQRLPRMAGREALDALRADLSRLRQMLERASDAR